MLFRPRWNSYSPVRSIFNPPIQTTKEDQPWDELSDLDTTPVECVNYYMDVDIEPYDGAM